MPANRRRRRAQAARARQARRQGGTSAPSGPVGRLVAGGSGIVLLALGIVLLAMPSGVHRSRGPALLVVAGLILVGLAIRPR